MGPFDRHMKDRLLYHAKADTTGFGEDDSEAGPESMEYLRKLEDSVRTGRLEYKERVQSTTRLNRTIKQVPEKEVVIRGVQNDLDKSDIPMPGQQIRARARQAAASRTERPVTPGTDGSFAVGTILRFEDHSLGVFKDARTDKDYEVVYLLLADGTVRPQGMALESYDVKVLGKLPAEFVHRLQRRLTWKRDEVIFHLEHFDYCEMIPHPDPDAIVEEEEEEVPEAATNGHNLVRGRRLTLSFGPGQAWQAVYWGDDDLGPLVAHKTAENWALMHLDLSRFADSMQVGEMAEESLMDEIEGDLAIV
jgi:hypothetical protein